MPYRNCECIHLLLYRFRGTMVQGIYCFLGVAEHGHPTKNQREVSAIVDLSCASTDICEKCRITICYILESTHAQRLHHPPGCRCRTSSRTKLKSAHLYIDYAPSTRPLLSDQTFDLVFSITAMALAGARIPFHDDMSSAEDCEGN